LSHLSAEEQKKYLPRLEKNYEEFERLREQVRPLVPTGVHLWPGTKFGPMNGSWGVWPAGPGSRVGVSDEA
jgi:hypothetical protein